eukprot:CAMPEP_0182450514 /NCGR_PEP_ID=MMETSP1172-20130603/41781_1 /TAXON_ID=708627 /ORGANISM="Timspurckia oligopyrenoides, Strain CCMP3278" /LENGTH=548 /DNA_ID=CAMNT_0024648141 /DNA_START=67 /DNA_END=1713 /DNA_ORIENTATION=-
MSSIPIDYVLDNRYIPGSQRVRIPSSADIAAQCSDDDSDIESSLRANFLPPGLPFISADDPVLVNYATSYPSSLLSPMFTHLPSIQPSQLYKPSDSVQSLRRKLLRGANVLIVQGGYSGKKFVYQKLKDLGVSITILDGPDSPWKFAAEQGLIDDFCALDFTDHVTVFERAMELIFALEQSFDAVTTYFEDAVPLAARIATALGLQNNPIQACDRARNKSMTRQVMKESGLVVPKFYRVRSESDLNDACDHVGFPAVLKPVFGAASMGVTKVFDKQGTKESYEKIMSTLDVKNDTIWAQGTEMVLEEYYDGDEFDVDLLLFEGSVVYSKVIDNWATCEPFFQESGVNCPSLYPEKKQMEMVQLAVDSTLALGFKYGAFHVELKYTSKGARLIEVNARMGGVSVYDCHLTAWGIDLVEEHMMAVLKIPICPKIPENPLAYFAESAINAPYSGVMKSDTWLDAVLSDARVRSVTYFSKKGEKVVGPEDGVPTWIAEIRVVDAFSGDAALGFIRDLMMNKVTEVPILASVPGSERSWFFPDSCHPFVKVTE